MEWLFFFLPTAWFPKSLKSSFVELDFLRLRNTPQWYTHSGGPLTHFAELPEPSITQDDYRFHKLKYCSRKVIVGKRWISFMKICLACWDQTPKSTYEPNPPRPQKLFAHYTTINLNGEKTPLSSLQRHHAGESKTQNRMKVSTQILAYEKNSSVDHTQDTQCPIWHHCVRKLAPDLWLQTPEKEMFPQTAHCGEFK